MKESSNEKLNEKFHNEQNTMKEEVLTDMPPSNKNECCSANNYEDVMDNYGEEEEEEIPGVKFVNYHDESQIHSVMRLVGKDLSEPYSVFTYRYFLHRFPQLCIFAVPTKNTKESGTSNNHPHEEPIGCVVCKIDPEDETNDDYVTYTDNNNNNTQKLCGYMAMLAVDTSYRRSGIGTALVKKVLRRMQNMGCQSVTLETEVSNKAAMKLYEERLGFVREEFLARYYLNWGDAYRLKLYFPTSTTTGEEEM